MYQENSGVVSARVNGVKHAHGEWIGFVDGDDVIEEDMYEFLLSNALENDAQISHCGYKKVFDNGETISYYDTGKIVHQDNISALEDLISGVFIEPSLCNKLYHNSLIQSFLQSNNFDYSIRNFEDLLINYYLFKECNSSIYEDRCKYCYLSRIGSASKSTESPTFFFDIKKVFETIMNDSVEYNINVSNIAFYRYISFLIDNSTSSNKDVCLEILKNNSSKIISASFISKKIKIKFVLTVYFHSLFCFIKRIYYRVNRKDGVHFE